jgi:hypothetical protein
MRHRRPGQPRTWLTGGGVGTLEDFGRREVGAIGDRRVVHPVNQGATVGAPMSDDHQVERLTDAVALRFTEDVTGDGLDVPAGELRRRRPVGRRQRTGDFDEATVCLGGDAGAADRAMGLCSSAPFGGMRSKMSTAPTRPVQRSP